MALSPDGERALLTIRDDVKKVYAVYMGLFPTLEVQRVGLASPPIAAGVVAGAGRGYVAQKHPEGRITFVTLDSGEARTLTGFELARASWIGPNHEQQARCPRSAGRPRRARRSQPPAAAIVQRPGRSPPSIEQAFGLTRAVAVVDAPADRVVVLMPGANQSLRIDSVHVGRNILTVVASPRREQAARAVGRSPREDRGRRGRREAFTDGHRTGGARRSNTCWTTLTDPLAGLAIDPIEERWAVMYASTGPDQAFVQNPNELVFLDVRQPPETADAATRTRCTASAAVRRGSTFTPHAGLPGGDAAADRESEQDLSILDSRRTRATRSRFRSTSGNDTRRLAPAAVVVDDGDPASDDDARIGVRLQNDPSVITLTLEPEPGHDRLPADHQPDRRRRRADRHRLRPHR